MIAASRPVDISPVIVNLQNILSETDNSYQRELLRLEIAEMSGHAVSGEIVERQFYYYIWEKNEGIDSEQNLLQNGKLLCECFTDCGISAEILDAQSIIRLNNLINNPEYIHLEDAESSISIPFISFN
jgi:hypothetical protein